MRASPSPAITATAHCEPISQTFGEEWKGALGRLGGEITDSRQGLSSK